MKKVSSILTTLCAAAAFGLATTAFVGCEESAEDNIEDAADEAGDAMDDAADEMGDAMDDAGDAMDDALNN